MTDPRTPRPRAMPAHLEPDDAPQRPPPDPGPPEPKVKKDMLDYLRHNFPEQFYTPEMTTDSRLWYNQGVRCIVKHLEILAERQTKKE